MSGHVVDRTGFKVGSVEVLRFSHLARNGAHWVYRCACGTEKVAAGSDLARGKVLSCGCLVAQRTALRNTKHGLSRSPVYKIWSAMRQRCRSSKWYVPKGIKVCPRWLDSFEAFYEDMGPRPSPRHSIDRIDNAGHYEPGNCRWATDHEQMANTDSAVLLSVLGETQPIRGWARITGLGASCIRSRLATGMSPEDTILTPSARGAFGR